MFHESDCNWVFTSSQQKMESMLRKAWDAEGSPFRGQTYDPSLINFTGGTGFGDG